MIWTKAGMWYMANGFAIRRNGCKWWLYKNGTVTIEGSARIFDRLIDAKQAARKLYAREIQGVVK